jgi:hemolysin III
MNDVIDIKHYSPHEEKTNIISHAIGFILSIVALVLLVTHAIQYGNIWHIVSFSIFGASLIILYGASAFYHSTKKPELRVRLRVFDHASIYVLIAGTYTPFTLVTLNGSLGWSILGISWGMALTGIILKIYFTGRYKLISTLMYVFMGWIIVFAIKPVYNNLPLEGFLWLVAGGLSYTIGAIIYSIKKIKFNHAIFHMFVLGGSACHFFSVFFYVLPSK